jgi:Rad52/22 family double-strand break repair protein
MGFSAKQLHALRRDVKRENIRNRISNGRELSYIEGGYAIAEANRIFGFDGWDRETLDSRCVVTRENRGNFLVVYTSKVRITVRADGEKIVREGHGCGEARGMSAGETHDLALKISETDATKRALATFGKPFGLALYLGKSARETSKDTPTAEPAPMTTAEPQPSGAPEQAAANGHGIDKSLLKFAAARRNRDKTHLRFVASQPCLLCERQPSDPHHLRFAQPRGLGMKVSDEFTVPLCREHHRQLHHSGNESAWWHDMGIEPIEIARSLWNETHPVAQGGLLKAKDL